MTYIYIVKSRGTYTPSSKKALTDNTITLETTDRDTKS